MRFETPTNPKPTSFVVYYAETTSRSIVCFCGAKTYLYTAMQKHITEKHPELGKQFISCWYKHKLNDIHNSLVVTYFREEDCSIYNHTCVSHKETGVAEVIEVPVPKPLLNMGNT